MDKQLKQFQKLIGKKIKIGEPLAKYTTFKIGGPAKYFFIAHNNKDLVWVVNFAEKNNIPYYVFAGGSNILVSDKGFKGLVILNKADKIIFNESNKVIADAGVKLMDLIQKTVEKKLTGLESLAGIPGSVGGAVRGNAGAYGGEVADNIVSVEIIRKGKHQILSRDQCHFKYRNSIFKNNKDLIISSEFQLGKGEKQKSRQTIKEILQKRKNCQPLEYPSAGCVFKNILINSENIDQVKKIKNLPHEYLKYKKISAAWLLDYLGLKGKAVGQAQVSEKHANFIINTDKARASDVLKLINLVKNKVKDRFSIDLEEEIELVGF